MTEDKNGKKDDVITDDLINDMVSCIDVIRSKHSQTDAYQFIKLLNPILEPFRIKLIGEYFQVVAEIEKDKRRLSPAGRRTYLTRLLTPLIKLNSLHPSGKNPYLEPDGTYPFMEEKIWIDKEINIKELQYDKQKYSIDFEYSKPFDWFDPDAPNITIWDEYRAYIDKKEKKDSEAKARGIKFIPIAPLDEGKTSIRELYKKWLPTLTEDKIKSDDLLDQILVCFTIKRALNGDEKAIEKLYNLFENTAVGIAVNMALKRQIAKSYIWDGKEGGDFKQEARVCLRFLIAGSKPEDIVSSLSKGEKVPLQIEKFYFWYYSDYVPKELDRIMKHSSNRLDRLEIDYLLNPIAPIDDYTSWQNTPKRIVKFNSGSFRPGGGTHYFTTWLFGTNRNYMQGRFCQVISERIDCYWKMKKEVLWNPSDLDQLEQEESSNDTPSLSDGAPLDVLCHYETMKKVNDFICSKGISKRDAEIFIKNVEGQSKTALAQEYELSRMQIYRICKTISLFIKKHYSEFSL